MGEWAWEDELGGKGSKTCLEARSRYFGTTKSPKISSILSHLSSVQRVSTTTNISFKDRVEVTCKSGAVGSPVITITLVITRLKHNL